VARSDPKWSETGYRCVEHPCPVSKTQQVFYYEKAINFCFQQAAKDLPRGCRPDPILWCTPKLEELLQARNDAWETATPTKEESDWQCYKEAAHTFYDELRKEKTKAWEDFSATLDYNLQY